MRVCPAKSEAFAKIFRGAADPTVVLMFTKTQILTRDVQSLFGEGGNCWSVKEFIEAHYLVKYRKPEKTDCTEEEMDTGTEELE